MGLHRVQPDRVGNPTENRGSVHGGKEVMSSVELCVCGWFLLSSVCLTLAGVFGWAAYKIKGGTMKHEETIEEFRAKIALKRLQREENPFLVDATLWDLLAALRYLGRLENNETGSEIVALAACKWADGFMAARAAHLREKNG